MKQLVLMSLVVTLCSACVIDARNRNVPLFDAPKTVTQAVEPATPIWLRIPAGDVTVSQSTDQTLSAELMVMCPSRNSRCAEKMHDLDLALETDEDGVHLGLSKNRAFSFRNSSAVVRVAVPQDHPLHIDVTAGDVDLEIANCSTVNMEAGDLYVRVPESAVRSVKIDTGVGDASLHRRGRTLSGRRSFLIGAEVDWDGGPGQCDLDLDLQAGDARVELR